MRLRRSHSLVTKVKSKGNTKFGAIAIALLVTGCAVPQVASDPVHWGVPADSGTGRRIVYRKPTQQVWLVDASGAVIDAFLVSGRLNNPNPGTT